MYKVEEFTLINNVFPRVWQSKYQNVIIIESPVMNCQHCSIGGFEHILTKNNIINIGRQLKEIQKLANFDRRNFIVDINNELLEKLNKIFKNRILSQSEYISSNGNDRVLCIISFNKIKNKNG